MAFNKGLLRWRKARHARRWRYLFRDIQAEFVVAAAEVLDEGVPGTDDAG
jgi:hypothetical protein